jgi:hypothetical protein
LSDYLFWLADDWSSAPKCGPPAELGTKPPILADWQSRFRGKTIEDVVAFMKTVLAERNIDYHYFCVLGEDFQKRKLVTMWRIGDIDLVGDELDSLPISAAGKLLRVPFAMQPAYETNPQGRLNSCLHWSLIVGRKSRDAILGESL